MLSRRNVRVKVMQLLYAERVDAALTPRLTAAAFSGMVEDSYATLLFELYAFTHVLREARAEQKRRGKRLRKTAADDAFRPHVYDNPIVLALANSPELARAAASRDFAELLDDERLRGFYDKAKSFDGYEDYATTPEPTRDQHLGAVLKAHKALMDDEGYNDYLEDCFARWEQDKSLVIGAAKKVIKSLPDAALDADGTPSKPFLYRYETPSETADDFGKHLLDFVLAEDERLLELIKPVLKNWDAERVAVLDMVLLKMALGELLEFPQIPPKVTLNEYVELAKTYSTDKSKEFVNGVLDALLRSLRAEGRIVKEGRGLVE